jgi:(p)ppGpp synthase/HD superfamily hydrolase
MSALSGQFIDALAYATELHDGQTRKGTEIPYVSHLLAVCGLVLENGGGETEAIAALLHDGPEDRGGEATLADIRSRYGDGVADIVAACSDTFETPKPPWKARKEAYIAAIAHKSEGARLVSAADKLHNARAILADLREHGSALWDRFNAGGDDVLWYYRSLCDALAVHGETPLVDGLRRTVDAIAAEMEACGRS